MKFFALVFTVLASITPKAFADDPAPADVKEALAFFDKLADTVVADKGTCPKMGTDMNSLIDANADVLKKRDEARAKGQKLPKDAEQHMKDTARRMMPAIMPCTKDASVKSAMDRLKLPHGH